MKSISFNGVSERALIRGVFPLGVLILSGFLWLISTVLGPITAIKGTHALVGLIIAWVLFTLTARGDYGASRLPGEASPPLGRWLTLLREVCKILPFLIVLFSIIVSMATNARLAVIFILLPVGYFSLIVLLYSNVQPRIIITRATALFAVPVLSKYLTSAVYFGNTDTFEHVAAARALLAQGRLSAISSHYGLYAQVPGLHTATAALSSMAQVPMYDSFMILGIVFSVASVALIYGLFSAVFSEELAVYIMVAYSILVPPLFYANYFFPQAMTTILYLTLLLIAVHCVKAQSLVRRQFTVIGVLLAVMIPFVHHLTVIFFSAFLIILLIPALVDKLGSQRTAEAISSIPNTRLFIIVSVIGVTHWVVNIPGFLEFLGAFVVTLLFESGPIVDDTGGIRSVVGLGEPYQYQTVSEAFVSVIYLDGIYYVLLTAIFTIGAAVVVLRSTDYDESGGYIVLGLMGSLFVLRTPLVNLVGRIALSIAPFFAIILGVGLKRLASHDETRVRRVGAVVLLLLFVTAPAVVADDQYRLQAGPNLYDVYNVPEVQRDFSADEWSQLETTGKYASRSDSSMNTFTITNRALDSMGADAVENYAVSEENQSIVSGQPFVYREKWTEHRVGFDGERVGSLVMDERWLRDSVRTEDKVYTTGSIGILWDGEEAVLTDSPESIR